MILLNRNELIPLIVRLPMVLFVETPRKFITAKLSIRKLGSSSVRGVGSGEAGGGGGGGGGGAAPQKIYKGGPR
jgi:uncharacterized membrane protein YgcG